MSVSIRLAKIGKKHSPKYRLVVNTTKDKRNGKFLEIIGHYDPVAKSKAFVLDQERFDYWKGQGAIISEAVNKLTLGKYTFVPYNPKSKVENKSETKEIGK
jgi:small subunit ribosomal protein S16